MVGYAKDLLTKGIPVDPDLDGPFDEALTVSGLVNRGTQKQWDRVRYDQAALLRFFEECCANNATGFAMRNTLIKVYMEGMGLRP